jgi:hypothetical protein
MEQLYIAMVGKTSVSPWLATDKLPAQFAAKQNEAVQGYRQFVA